MNPKLSRILRPGLSTALGLFLLISISASGAENGASPAPAPEASPVASAAPVAPVKLTKSQAASLSREFRRAQSTELKAIRHRQKLEMKELKASQRARVREWKEQENVARRKLFAGQTDPKERRAYFKDRQDRYDALLKIQADERAQHEKEHEARIGAIEQDQAAQQKSFAEYLDRGERPPESLWPQGR